MNPTRQSGSSFFGAALLFAAALASLLLLPGASAAEPDTAWEEAGARDGVQMFVRRVPGSSIKAVRADAVFDAPPEHILAVLADVSSYPRVMPPTETARMLRREGLVSWFYMVINPPVISRRDYCIRIELSRLPDGRLRSGWDIDPTLCPPPQPGMLRIARNQGSWLLTPLRGGQATQVRYEAHTDPGGAVPAWMVNSASARSLPRIFQALRSAAASPRYASRAAHVAF